MENVFSHLHDTGCEVMRHMTCSHHGKISKMFCTSIFTSIEKNKTPAIHKCAKFGKQTFFFCVENCHETATVAVELTLQFSFLTTRASSSTLRSRQWRRSGRLRTPQWPAPPSPCQQWGANVAAHCLPPPTSLTPTPHPQPPLSLFHFSRALIGDLTGGAEEAESRPLLHLRRIRT